MNRGKNLPASAKEKALPASSREPVAIWVFALILLVVLAYLPALRSGFVWDDDDYVTANEAVQSSGGLVHIWFDLKATPQYYPLAFTTFWLEHQLWGLRPAGYHFSNVLLHGLVAVLLWRLFRLLNLPAPWLAAAVFAVHPVHVESVAWITERKNVLSGVFFLCTVLSWLRWSHTEQPGGRDKAGWGWYVLTLLFFVAALLSKTAVAPLPVVLLVLVWWKQGRIGKRDLLAVIPMLLLAAASALITIYVEHAYTTHQAEGNDWPYTLLERVLIAGRALWFYAGKLVWPLRITFVYPRWIVDQAAWWQYLYPAAAAIVLGGLFVARKWLGRGPFAAVLAYMLLAGPVLGIIDIYYMRYSLFADHFQYLPSMSLIGLFVGAGALLIQSVGPRVPQGKPTILMCITLLAVLMAKTWHECGKFHDIKTLWRDTLRENPEAWIAHNNLGTLLKDEKDFAAAVYHLNEAVRLKPDHGRAYLNLATAYIGQEQYEKAAEALRKGLQLVPKDGPGHVNLANILSDRGQLQEAEAHFLKAIPLLPATDPLPRYNYALMLLQQSRRDEAVTQLQAILRIKPGWEPARQQLQQLGASLQ